MRAGVTAPEAAQDETVVTVDDVVGWVKSGRALGMLRRFDESRVLVQRMESVGRPLPLGLALRWMTKGAVRLEDTRGRSREVDAHALSEWIAQLTREPFEKRVLLRDVEHAVALLEQAPRATRASLDLSKPPLYLRSDVSSGVRAGGSIGHIAGVLNQLKCFGPPPIFVTTDEIATVDAGVEQHLVTAPEAFWNFRELPTFVLNDTLEAGAMDAG